MNKNKYYYLFFALTLLFSACSSDLDVTGKYKETMVVYGLLDQSKSFQYIKINKAFLGQGSAYEYAKIKDSTQFVNSLTVKLKRLSDGVEFNLAPDNSMPKDPGTFYSSDQQNAIYSINSIGAAALNTNSQYRLTILNNETATQVTAQTSLINDATFTGSIATSQTFGFILPSNANFMFQVRWNSGLNAKIYQLVVRFNYIDSTISGNTQQKLDWIFPQQSTENLMGGQEMKNDFLGQGFLQFVGNQLTNPAGLIARRALKIDLFLIAGGDEINTFMEVNKPSTSLVQEKPSYTNISNGLGVFSSRYRKAPLSKPLNKASLDELSCGQYTKSLKFLDYSGAVCQ